jgi:hypothetical protein
VSSRTAKSRKTFSWNQKVSNALVTISTWPGSGADTLQAEAKEEKFMSSSGLEATDQEMELLDDDETGQFEG